MNSKPPYFKKAVRSTLVAAPFVCFGCVPGASTPDPAINGAQVGTLNDSFDAAINVDLGTSDSALVGGIIADAEQVNVFNLGPFQAGDRIIVDVNSLGSPLDADAAIFDANHDMVFENDDRNLDLNQLEPFMNFVVRHDSAVYYLGITDSAAADIGAMTGSYQAMIQIARDGKVPPTAGQIVVLNFAGGTINFQDGETYTTTPFDTADISPQYAGLTSAVMQQIVSVVAQQYEGLDLDLRPIPGSILPSDGTYSTIFFGARAKGLFGLSQDVDYYNQIMNDESIVFTDNFTPKIFGQILTATQLGTAIGNVATHEIGHLLGLTEAANITDPMDNTGTANTLLVIQHFQDSPLQDIAFPIGLLNSPVLLLETLGPGLPESP